MIDLSTRLGVFPSIFRSRSLKNNTSQESEQSRNENREIDEREEIIEENQLTDDVFSILELHISHINYLPMKHLLTNPVVQVSIVDRQTGQLLSKSDVHRSVIFPHEYTVIDGEKMYLDVILPFQTKTCDMEKVYPEFPKWKESLIVNDDYKHLSSESSLFLFEILDLDKTLPFGMTQNNSSNHGWQHIAWAYYLPTAQDTNSTQLDLEKSLDLRLFWYKKSFLAKLSNTYSELKHSLDPSISVRTNNNVEQTQPLVSSQGNNSNRRRNNPHHRNESNLRNQGNQNVNGEEQEEESRNESQTIDHNTEIKTASTKIIPEIFELYKAHVGYSKCEQIHDFSCLKITLKSVPQKEMTLVERRPIHALQYEKGQKIGLEHFLNSRQYADEEETSSRNPEEEHSQISEEKKEDKVVPKKVIPKERIRDEHESTVIPDELCFILDGGDFGSIRLEFSHSGLYLAIACTETESMKSVIRIYSAVDGELECSFDAHSKIIYDLDWSENDESLLSASADGTAKIWIFETNNPKKQLRNQHSLLHDQEFIYTAKFHPQNNRIIATGGSAGKIRIWSTENLEYSSIIKEIGEKTENFISSICFDKRRHHIYSVDSSGQISIWNSRLNSSRIAPFTLLKTMLESEIEGQNLSKIECCPDSKQQRILVHCRDNIIRIIDTSTNRIYQRLRGSKSFLNALKSSWSPDGRYVVSGSATGDLHFWDAKTSQPIEFPTSHVLSNREWTSMSQNTPAYDVAWNDKQHMIAVAMFGKPSPVYVLTHRKAVSSEIEDVTSPQRTPRTEDKPETISSPWTPLFNSSAQRSVTSPPQSSPMPLDESDVTDPDNSFEVENPNESKPSFRSLVNKARSKYQPPPPSPPRETKSNTPEREKKTETSDTTASSILGNSKEQRLRSLVEIIQEKRKNKEKNKAANKSVNNE
eukprot:gb/GECH01010456.1/.p1 GENE.gb/GECH01010456.1/~~gb/GECH01010456.1/.p1  ORF type:complete len:925 (+),score=219.93 gb/GECH01010456.1/:1-2775(+)